MREGNDIPTYSEARKHNQKGVKEMEEDTPLNNKSTPANQETLFEKTWSAKKV